ncbi:MAG: pyridoxal 5'-phosphate synthase glutaminase subunit PdxT [Promethearchaeota archaeon]
MSAIIIGILGLQGDFLEFSEGLYRNCEILEQECEARLVTTHADLEELDGLIIPGGESTVIGQLMLKTRDEEKKESLLDAIKTRIGNGMPTLGVCAGAILLAKNIRDINLGEISQPRLGTLDMEVLRNSYGRQNLSFEAQLNYPTDPDHNETGVFIRSPRILATGPEISVLAEMNQETVAVQKENQFASTFHPELEHESLILKRFIETIATTKTN